MVMLYGWIIVGIFSVITGAVMGEICSRYPVAGSVYYWSGALAKRKNAPFASYITGWLNFFGYIAFLTSFSYGLAKILVGFMSVGNSEATSVHETAFLEVLVALAITLL